MASIRNERSQREKTMIECAPLSASTKRPRLPTHSCTQQPARSAQSNVNGGVGRDGRYKTLREDSAPLLANTIHACQLKTTSGTAADLREQGRSRARADGVAFPLNFVSFSRAHPEKARRDARVLSFEKVSLRPTSPQNFHKRS